MIFVLIQTVNWMLQKIHINKIQSSYSDSTNLTSKRNCFWRTKFSKAKNLLFSAPRVVKHVRYAQLHKTQNLKVNIIKINFASTPTSAYIFSSDAHEDKKWKNYLTKMKAIKLFEHFNMMTKRGESFSLRGRRNHEFSCKFLKTPIQQEQILILEFSENNLFLVGEVLMSSVENFIFITKEQKPTFLDKTQKSKRDGNTSTDFWLYQDVFCLFCRCSAKPEKRNTMKHISLLVVTFCITSRVREKMRMYFESAMKLHYLGCFIDVHWKTPLTWEWVCS